MRGDDSGLGRLGEFVDMLRTMGISFFASFGLGRDWDGEGVSDRVLEIWFARQDNDVGVFHIFPVPGLSALAEARIAEQDNVARMAQIQRARTWCSSPPRCPRKGCAGNL